MVLIGILLNERGVGCVERWLERLEDRVGRLEELHQEEIRDLLSLLGDQGQRLIRLEERYSLGR